MFSHYQPKVASHPTSSGSLASDCALGYTLCWPTWEHFDVWLKKEQHEKGIELIRKNIRRASPDHPWQEQHEFVCARQGAVSLPKYTLKHPEWNRNMPSKRSGCPCRLTVKIYPGTAEVLSMYKQEHTQMIGNDNLKFTCLSGGAKAQIKELLQLGVHNDCIVSRSTVKLAVTGSLLLQIEIIHEEDSTQTGSATRDEFVGARDVRQIQVMLNINICHPD